VNVPRKEEPADHGEVPTGWVKGKIDWGAAMGPEIGRIEIMWE